MKKSKFLTLILLGMGALVSCGSGNTLTVEKTDYQLLGTSNVTPRYLQQGINFTFSEGLKFDSSKESQYKVDVSSNVKEALLW